MKKYVPNVQRLGKILNVSTDRYYYLPQYEALGEQIYKHQWKARGPGERAAHLIPLPPSYEYETTSGGVVSALALGADNSVDSSEDRMRPYTGVLRYKGRNYYVYTQGGKIIDECLVIIPADVSVRVCFGTIICSDLDTAKRLFDAGYVVMYSGEEKIPEFDTIMRFPLRLNLSIPAIQEQLFSWKRKANDFPSLLKEDVDELHRMAHTCHPSLAWFFTPDGHYEYGLAGERYGHHSWLHRMEYIYSSYTSSLENVLNANLSTVTRSCNIYDVETMFQYFIPGYIRDILHQINKKEVRVVLAGGFVVTQGDYDFFVLNNDIDAAKELAFALGKHHNYPADEDVECNELFEDDRFHISYRGSVITMEHFSNVSYQIIMFSNKKSVEDVLENFDFSHCQIAHDGTSFIMTSAFLTFMWAHSTLQLRPYVQEKRQKKLLARGYTVFHCHTSICTVEVPEIQFYPSSLRNVFEDIEIREIDELACTQGYTSDSKVKGQEKMKGSDMIAKYTLHKMTFFLNENGFHVEYYDIDPDEYYLCNTYTPSKILIYVRKIISPPKILEC